MANVTLGGKGLTARVVVVLDEVVHAGLVPESNRNRTTTLRCARSAPDRKARTA